MSRERDRERERGERGREDSGQRQEGGDGEEWRVERGEII